MSVNPLAPWLGSLPGPFRGADGDEAYDAAYAALTAFHAGQPPIPREEFERTLFSAGYQLQFVSEGVVRVPLPEATPGARRR